MTAARFSNWRGSTAAIQAGEVSIDLDCSACHETDERLSLAFGDLEPGDGGSEKLDIVVGENPVRLWFRTACPPAVDPLGEALSVTLSLERGGDRRFLQSGSLTELRETFSDGTRLDDHLGDPCLSPGQRLSLGIDYELPSDADWTMDLQTEFAFELYAEQCRHVSEDDASSRDPFENVSGDCPELACPDWVELGKFETDGKQPLEPNSTYEFDELKSEFDDDHTYEIGVLTVTNKENETVCASFRVLKDGAELDEPYLREVVVAGGPDPNRKQGRDDSGKKWDPPDNWGPAEETYSIDPPSTRTNGELCTKDERYGISHVRVFVCTDEPMVRGSDAAGTDGGEGT